MPRTIWDYVIEYVCYVWNRMARKELGDITPLEALTGDTPDISELFDFEFREPVRYLENPEIKQVSQAQADVGMMARHR